MNPTFNAPVERYVNLVDAYEKPALYVTHHALAVDKESHRDGGYVVGISHPPAAVHQRRQGIACFSQEGPGERGVVLDFERSV